MTFNYCQHLKFQCDLWMILFTNLWWIAFFQFNPNLSQTYIKYVTGKRKNIV